MKAITSSFAGHDKVYYIYENVQEAEQNGIVPVPITLAKVGDYVLSNNGYYVPVLGIHIYPRKKKQTDYALYKVHFPRMRWCGNIKLSTNVVIGKKVFNYSFEPKTHTPSALSYRTRFFANLLVRGVDIETAFKKSFKYNRTQSFFKQINQVLKNKSLYLHLKELGYMDSLKSKMTDIGMNTDYIANTIKNIIDAPDSNASLKKWALQFVIDTTQEEKRGNNDFFNEEQDMNALIETSILKSLPLAVVQPSEDSSVADHSGE